MREPLAMLQVALLVAGVLALEALASGTRWFLGSVASYGDDDRELVLREVRCGEANAQGQHGEAQHATSSPRAARHATRSTTVAMPGNA